MEIINGIGTLKSVYLNNVYRDGRVVAYMCLEVDEEYYKQVENFKQYGGTKLEKEQLMEDVINNCGVAIRYDNEECLQTMIDSLIRIKNNTEWEWKE